MFMEKNKIKEMDDDCSRALTADRVRRIREASLRPTRRTTLVYLIRHATSTANIRPGPKLHNGRHIEVGLSDGGRVEALRLRARLVMDGVVFDRVYASDALRAQETAEIACRRSPEIVDGIGEISMGGWTGQTISSCDTPTVRKEREADAWEWRPPGVSFDEGLPGESYRDVEDRFMAFLEGILSGGTVAVFSHHAAIRCVLRAVLEASPRMLAPKLEPGNTSITVLRYDATSVGRKGGWSVVCINDTAHLATSKL